MLVRRRYFNTADAAFAAKDPQVVYWLAFLVGVIGIGFACALPLPWRKTERSDLSPENAEAEADEDARTATVGSRKSDHLLGGERDSASTATLALVSVLESGDSLKEEGEGVV